MGGRGGGGQFKKIPNPDYGWSLYKIVELAIACLMSININSRI